MPIRALTDHLINQIAAGEVVERPAAALKELLENALDSGATQIDVDVGGGGTERIRVADNGSGIEREELSLAVARHATSKLATADDLAAIATLGLRGEALAPGWAIVDALSGPLALAGYAVRPAYATRNDGQYVFVNGRFVRDRVIAHALREAYRDVLHHERQPSFALWLALEPRHVDV